MSGDAAAPPSDPRVRPLCDIIARVPPDEVEAALARCGVTPLPSTVESVLRLSYAHPAAAVRFFRWAGLTLKHTPYAWNLMVDVLGKNGQFEGMWDAIRSMKQEDGALSAATFASAFGSYCSAGRIKEALMTFDVMDRYGVPPDPVSLNSLLSAICRAPGANTSQAADFLDRAKSRVSPDADSFAILLEGWEKESNAPRANNTFGEMIIRVGWLPSNVPAYDAFLTTLVRNSKPDDALNFLKVMKSKNCLPGSRFFSNALDVLVKNKDAATAVALWDAMAISVTPNLIMYNAMIALLCDARSEAAFSYLDAMPFHGVFPDALTYNTVFEWLVHGKRAREAERFLAEMRRNGCPPSPANCAAAVRMFFDGYDPSAALAVWGCVVEDRVAPADEVAHELLKGLHDLGRPGEVRRYAEDMLEMGIELSSAAMEKVKTAYTKAGKTDSYDRIARRNKAR